MRELSDEAVVEILTENGIGVLALSSPTGTSPYPIPVAFGYDPATDSLAFHLSESDGSRKHQALTADANVGFTVYEETEPQSVWRSVVVTGTMVETTYSDVEPALASLASNTQFAPNPVSWDDTSTTTPYELRIDDWSGREFRVG
ncbi:pyridoxamine 5'-phosphate oxidase family protein [Haloarcula sp. S1AR25-5A]|uniref:Pyridoxamine 5'-phosphate oxidase family protein n=1 Tax=Haloarcula terrestris TaxID=2950533 RepID=A0AAE4F1E6_9EURY|nr:pyridoxamine 5'-phosphate oxidase family protein [Haloarcula terrestris]MDS0222778.1 pyridoxamine 5'-phosphate oxidase family protein [Haloarcula terrestris]